MLLRAPCHICCKEHVLRDGLKKSRKGSRAGRQAGRSMSAPSSTAVGVSGYVKGPMMVVFLSSAVSKIIETDIANVLRCRYHITFLRETAFVNK